MSGYPGNIVEANHVEPVPRRIRAYLDGVLVLDTVSARYVWEHPNYPQYYIPMADVAPGLLVRTGQVHPSRRGAVETCALRVNGGEIERAAKLHLDDTVAGLADTVRFEWAILGQWFEEDEQVFVHPRSPYNRVDAIRSNRTVRVEWEGTVLAESSSPVMVFETGLPTRYYLPRTNLDYTHLEPSETMTSCPYKGDTSGYWSVRIGGTVTKDIAWVYDFPTAALLPIAGLIAFYNEKVDTFLDGVALDRPKTAFG